MNNRLQAILANKHTSGAAVAYLVAIGVAQLGAVWFPAYAAQFKETTAVIEKLALFYGMIMAGDAPPKPEEPPKP